MPRAIRSLLALACVAFCSNSALAQTSKPVEPERALSVSPHFVGKGPHKPAKDISGIACSGEPGSFPRVCLAINDENRSAQLLTITRDSIAAGDEVPIIGAAPSLATLGVKPTNIGVQPVNKCPKEGEFAELDGEGIAFDKGDFYVVGSHGCSRNSKEFRLSSFLLARIRPSSSSGGTVNIETTYRLSDALRRKKKVARFFMTDLKTRKGLNVEGLAVIDGRLYAGLRAPSIKRKAFIVVAQIADLFAPGQTPLSGKTDLIELRLGKDVGIRDLARLPDGRLLVLAGPTLEQENVPFQLLAAEPRQDGKTTALAVLADEMTDEGKRAKAEAAVVLSVSPAELRVLILFDGLADGGPREYVVLLPKQ
jgi:Protein of unknown function (DUF3616)